MNNIKDKDKIKVFYNDTCPICKREINTYKLRSNNIEFRDSSLMEDKYNRRMHAYKDGVEYIGAEAFLIVWENTKGFKWLSYLFNNMSVFFVCISLKLRAFYDFIDCLRFVKLCFFCCLHPSLTLILNPRCKQ